MMIFYQKGITIYFDYPDKYKAEVNRRCLGKQNVSTILANGNGLTARIAKKICRRAAHKNKKAQNKI